MKTYYSFNKLIFTSLLAVFLINYQGLGQVKIAAEKGASQVIPFNGIVDTFQVQMPQQSSGRIIFLVHGLAGDASSWQMAGQWSQMYGNMICVYPTYSGNTLLEAAISLGQSIENIAIPLEAALNITDPTYNYVIAHSQGGLVTRRLQKFYLDENYPLQNKHFGGLITFGSPHQGARIANNIGNLKQYIAESLVTLSKGPALELLSDHWYLNMVISENNLTNLLEEFANNIPENILPVIMGDFAQKITESYMEGSSELNELNNFTYPYPAIVFYGLEDDPVLWRVLYSLNNDIDDAGYFNADYDEGYIPIVADNYLTSYLKHLEYENAAEEQMTDKAAWWQWMISPVFSSIEYCWDDILDADDYFGYGENSMQDIADAYGAAASWWLHANDDYKFFIGASEIHSFIHPVHYICQCEYFLNGTEIIDYTYQSLSTPCVSEVSSSANCEAIPILITELIEKESDGVVTAESAGFFPGGSNYMSIGMSGSNHEQMKNDTNGGLAFMNIFNGLYGTYFRF